MTATLMKTRLSFKVFFPEGLIPGILSSDKCMKLKEELSEANYTMNHFLLEAVNPVHSRNKKIMRLYQKLK